MQIPIKNIYYLLCYAWNKLEEKDRVTVSIDDKTKLLDLFAMVLAKGSKMLLKRGIDKNYIDHTEEIAGVKGKLDVSNTLKRNLHFKQKTICTYDDFSANILVNRILVATIQRLLYTKDLDKGLKYDLIHIRRMLSGVDEIDLNISLFAKIRLNRNNRFYAFIMNVCQIIYENTLPSEEKGSFTFLDFTRDDRQMNQLFESFVRNFYKIELRDIYKVSGEIIDWQFTYSDPTATDFLPKMKTDITLQNDFRKIIIDAKFYRETMVVNYDKQKIKSANLYQLFSYLLNQEEEDPKTRTATGILLYPTIVEEYSLDFNYNNHSIQIRTVNLNNDWQLIAERLKDIVGC
jgi:5-methylcytosine-specific restriction enzyme subunit McrC